MANLDGNSGASDFRCIATMGDDIFLGGQFNILNVQSVFYSNNIVKFNTKTQSWDWMSGGVNLGVYSIEIDHNRENTLLVGGEFTSVSYLRKPCGGLSYWNYTDWYSPTTSLSLTPQNTIHTISSVPGVGVFVGGRMENFENLTVDNVAFYNNSLGKWGYFLFSIYFVSKFSFSLYFLNKFVSSWYVWRLPI